MADTANVDLLTEQASGSVGGVTFARNQHGPYSRARTAPNDPASAAQLAVRAALSQCVTAWNSTLTQSERDTWDRYALAVKMATPLGRETNVGGLAMYVRSNVPRLQAAEASLPRVDVAPTPLNLASFTPISRVVFNLVDDTLHPFFTESDPWTTETGAAMLFWSSPAGPTTRNFYKGPYRYAGPLLGSDPALSSPGTIPAAFPAAPGERVHVRGRLTRSNGSLSSSFRFPTEIVPQVAPLPLSAKYYHLGGSFSRVIVTFDALLRHEAHTTANWQVHFNNTIWQERTVLTVGNQIWIGIMNIGATPTPNDVVFTPPPFDVNGLLTGLPVAAFTIPLV